MSSTSPAARLPVGDFLTRSRGWPHFGGQAGQERRQQPGHMISTRTARDRREEGAG